MRKIDWVTLDRDTVKVEESPVSDWRFYFPVGFRAERCGDAAWNKSVCDERRKLFNFRFDMHDPELKLAYDCEYKVFFAMPKVFVNGAKKRAKEHAARVANFATDKEDLENQISAQAKKVEELKKGNMDQYKAIAENSVSSVKKGAMTIEEHREFMKLVRSSLGLIGIDHKALKEAETELSSLIEKKNTLIEWGKKYGLVS